MASVAVHCPRCQSVQVYRHGHGQNPKGHARFRCRDCQFTYTYEARKHGVKEQM